MASWLNSWWAWMGAGLGVAGISVLVSQQMDPPVSEASPPELATISDEVAPVTDTAVNQAAVEGDDVAVTMEADPVLLDDTAAAALTEPEGEAAANVSVQADTAVATMQTPESALTPDAVLPAPEDPQIKVEAIEVLEPMESASSDLAPEGSLLGTSAAPLTLAQVLQPGVAPQPGQVAPSFDLVRVAPDGTAIIAGRAEPNAQVQIYSGGVPVAEATASSRGEFVVFLDNPSEPTLDVKIPTRPETARLVVSQDDIVILPAMPDAPDASAIVIRRTPDAVQIVQPSGPAIPSNVSLDLVSYSASGSVILAGRGQPDHTARIYANGALAGQVSISSGGDWRLEIDDIAEGRYVLRVDEISPEGAVNSRTESPFQREFPEANMPDSFSQGAKIIVQPGNTLWLMATEAYGSGDAYTQIFSANSEAIRDPNLIYPGQIFAIPRVEE